MDKLNLQQCIDKIKEEYPESYPYAFIIIEGKYVFDLVKKGEKPEGHISDMHVVDPETGDITGGISIMEFLKDEGFREKWKKPNLVSDHDKSLTHSNFSYRSNQNGWGVTLKNDENYLMHNGIRGQRWGVQNGPPYPLDSKTHNSVVKEAEGGRAEKGAPNRNFGKSANSNTIGMTSDTKEALVELAATSVPILSLLAVNAFVSSKFYAKRRQNKFNKRNLAVSEDLLSDIADVGKDFSEDKMPRKIPGNHSVEDDMAAVNPKYNNGVIPGTSVNCLLCSVTYDLRRRGYDVTALASESGTASKGVLQEDIYKDLKIDKIRARSWTEYFNKMASQYPEGSRGLLNASGPYMGHSMAWEIRNGKVELLDTQSNSKMTARELSNYGFDSNSRDNECMRLDNLELKPSGIKLASAELKQGWKNTINTERKQYNENNKNNSKFKELPMVAGKPSTRITDSQRRKNYEETYLKYHPNASKEAIDNYVNQQLRGGR